uniref:Uncharacterized protein n=1 Tax=Magallana gigas TaxID=29159 RepID=K1PVI7_MAGGI
MAGCVRPVGFLRIGRNGDAFKAFLYKALSCCGVSSAGYALGCSVGYHCCSKEDHTCCKDGTVCMGKACLGWRAMIGVVGACLAAFLLVCAAVGYLVAIQGIANVHVYLPDDQPALHVPRFGGHPVL